MSIITYGLDPEISKLTTWGYGPDVTVEVTVLPRPGGRSGKRRKQEDQLIRIRVIDEDGKTMIQERSIPLNELKQIKIRVNESGSYILGSDIYITVKQGMIREGESKQIRVTTHEAQKE